MIAMTVEQLRARPQAVRDRFEESRSALYRAYGIQLYADAEHNACLAALHATHDAPCGIEARNPCR
jgi:hypothetical protein